MVINITRWKLKFLILAKITDHVTSDQSEFWEGFGISETVSEVSPKPEIVSDFGKGFGG